MSDDESKSKSQYKREHHALQALGRALVEIPDSLLKRLPLPERVREQVAVGRRLQRGALQRQLRHLAGVLEVEDHAAIRAALKAALEPGIAEIRRLHELEAMREALLRDGDQAIAQVTERCPGIDIQQLRQLVRNARQAADAAASPRAARALFQFLKQHTAVSLPQRVDP